MTTQTKNNPVMNQRPVHVTAGADRSNPIRIAHTETFFEGSAQPCRTSNAAFPSLVNCGNRTLLMAHRVGTEKNSADGTQYLWRSVDDGRTWSRIPFPLSPAENGLLREYRTAALSMIGEGRVGMLLTWLDHFDALSPLANPETGGLIPLHIGWTESIDSGMSWAPIREITVSPAVQPCGNGPMVRLPTGRLLAAFETYKHWDDPTPWSAQSLVVASDDNGETWKTPIVVAADPEMNRFYWDHHLLVLNDGTLLDVCFSDDARKPGVSDIYVTRSRDDGETWSTAAPTGIQGQFSEVHQMPDGRLAIFYVVRTGNPSIRVRIGGADGQSWQSDDALILHSQQHDDLENSRNGDFSEYLDTMASWTFGWPSAVRLTATEWLAAYYVGRGNQSSIRLSRLAVSP
jgi:hypothetical protein